MGGRQCTDEVLGEPHSLMWQGLSAAPPMDSTRHILHSPRLVVGGWGLSRPGLLLGELSPTEPGVPCTHCRPQWPSMQAFLQATAEISAAPRPLPSSDSMNVISQLGVSLRTLAWNRSLKLQGQKQVCMAPCAHGVPLPRTTTPGSGTGGGAGDSPRVQFVH